MSKTRISPVPDGDLFNDVTVSVIQIGPDHIPDFDPGPLDRGLVRLQRAMHGKLQRKLDDVRGVLDWPPVRSRKELGMALRTGEPSDVSLAAVLLRQDSSFALQYDWAPGAIPLWPEGLSVVLWRGHLYERHGDVLTLWAEGRE